MKSENHFESIEQVTENLKTAYYIADRALATVLFLADRLQKPVFLEKTGFYTPISSATSSIPSSTNLCFGIRPSFVQPLAS